VNSSDAARLAAVALGLAVASVCAAGGLKGWPEQVRKIAVESTADSTPQPALFWAPEAGGEPAPLLVALHTWSGGYTQGASAPYARWCIEKGWVFIHPHFRGPNWTPQAAGSDLAVQDILDAVAYARKHARVDPRRVYLVGASGGGHAAVLMAGRAPEVWAAVSAWVPITDLKAWYAECRKAKRGYADHIVKACGGVPGESAKADRECEKRSPLTWIGKAAGVALDINAGIRDGHAGSVPISHTLRAFNALARDEDRLSDAEIAHFVERAAVPASAAQPKEELADATYGSKPPLFRRTSNAVRVTIFQGGHEIVFPAALAWLAKQQRPQTKQP